MYDLVRPGAHAQKILVLNILSLPRPNLWMHRLCNRIRPRLRSHGTSFDYLSPIRHIQLAQHSRWHSMLFSSICLCPALVSSVTRTTPQKAHCQENGLQETNGRANAEARHRTGIFSSDVDRHYRGDPDPKNNLGKAEKSKFFRQMHQKLERR